MKNKILTALISVVVAVGMWLYVVTVVSPNSDKQFNNIPVVVQSEIVLRERGLMITDTDISEVSLHLEGSRIDLNKLSSSNVSVAVDVSKIGEAGTHSLTFTPTFPGEVTSSAITVLSKTPGTVNVTVEERISKTVPIELVYSGSVAENFVADTENKIMDADSVMVTGPKSVIDQIKVAQVFVDLEGRNETLSEQLSYTLCDGKGLPVNAKLVTTDVEAVNLTLRIVRVKQIDLKMKVVYGGGATEETAVVNVEPASIQVSGSDSALKDLDSLELGTIDLSEIAEDQTLTYEIKLPEGVTNDTGVTEATVKVSFPELATKTLTVTNIQALNVPEGLKAELITQKLEVLLRGPQDQIDQLTEEDVTVNVDFSASQAGTVKVNAVIVTNAEGVGAVGAYTVSATLSEDKE